MFKLGAFKETKYKEIIIIKYIKDLLITVAENS